MIPKIIFKIANKDQIAEFIFDLKDSLESENLSERNYAPCIYIKFPEKLRNKILDSKNLTPKLKEEIENHIEISKNNEIEVHSFIKKMREYWGKVNYLFFSEMKGIIGDYFQKEYICYITDKVVGAYFNKNEITIDYKKDISLEKGSFILAEEILHLIYWELWERIYNKNINENYEEIFSIKRDKWSCWHIAEIIPEYLLVENEAFNKLGWNRRKRYLGYTWIPELRKILDPIWESKKNFRDFIIKTHLKLNCLP